MNESRTLFEIPLILNSGQNAEGITTVTIEDIPVSNNEEAVKRLLFPVVISK